MRKSSMLALYAMTTALAFGGLSGTTPSREYYEPQETEEERKARLSKAQIERYKSQGLTEFFYGENSVWVLNQKSADRKAIKNNWI